MTYLVSSPVPTRRPLISRCAGDVTDSEANGQEESADSAELDLRQLRHHTKNTLQRLLGVIAETPGLYETPAGERLARELEHRICLSATISNALFGLTGTPGSMQERLRQLAGAIVDLMRDSNQMIRVGVSVRGCCPPQLREAVVRAANELVGNAVKHGMRNRRTGRIVVRLHSDDACTVLSVADNGWGFSKPPRAGEGLCLARNFADHHGGSLTLEGTDGTRAVMTLPH
jgi:two-component sensor histidine kinase